MDDTMYRVLLKMRETNPKCMMIYIGESEGGCTANDDFFEALVGIEDNEFKNAVSNYKQSCGIYDFTKLIK